MKVKVMGREFINKKTAIHWLEVGIRLTSDKATKDKLMKKIRKLK